MLLPLKDLQGVDPEEDYSKSREYGQQRLSRLGMKVKVISSSGVNKQRPFLTEPLTDTAVKQSRTANAS